MVRRDFRYLANLSVLLEYSLGTEYLPSPGRPSTPILSNNFTRFPNLNWSYIPVRSTKGLDLEPSTAFTPVHQIDHRHRDIGIPTGNVQDEEFGGLKPSGFLSQCVARDSRQHYTW